MGDGCAETAPAAPRYSPVTGLGSSGAPKHGVLAGLWSEGERERSGAGRQNTHRGQRAGRIGGFRPAPFLPFLATVARPMSIPRLTSVLAAALVLALAGCGGGSSSSSSSNSASASTA